MYNIRYFKEFLVILYQTGLIYVFVLIMLIISHFRFLFHKFKPALEAFTLFFANDIFKKYFLNYKSNRRQYHNDS